MRGPYLVHKLGFTAGGGSPDTSNGFLNPTCSGMTCETWVEEVVHFGPVSLK